MTPRRPVRPALRQAVITELGPGLPGAVADRLAQLMAQDPGLAEAVCARLPEARAASARDLATYVLRTPTSTVDIVG
jgi:hypothetical protein